jgi:hypothetical protein
VQLDRAGWVWVQEYLVLMAEPEAFGVLDQAGKLRQRIALQPATTFLAADESTALFRTEDAVGTPRLMVMDRRCVASS